MLEAFLFFDSHDLLFVTKLCPNLQGMKPLADRSKRKNCHRKRFGWACAILMWNKSYIYIWIKIEYQEPHEAEKTVWVGMCHLSVEQIYIYIWIKIEYQEPHEAEKTVWVGMCHLSMEQIYIYG